MFPRRLQGAEGPAEALFREALAVLRRFGVSDGVLFIADHIAFPADGKREIGILGQGVVAETACFENQGLPPRAYRARNHRDGIEVVQSAAVEIEAVDIFDGLEARDPVLLIADARVAADRADARVFEMTR